MILDIALGILSALFVSDVFNVVLTTKLLLWGISFALLPDIDVVWGVLIKGNWWEKGIWGHRELTHYPVLYLPITLLVYIMAGSMWAILFLVGVFLHNIHDTFGIGWGIKWLWPFSHKSYSLFDRKNGERRFFSSWTQAEKTSSDRRVLWGNWMADVYFKYHLPVEIAGLVITLVVLFKI